MDTTTEVQGQTAQETGATATKETRTAAKAAAEKQSPQTPDKFALRRAAVKKQKRKAHRHSIAASHRNG